MATTKGYQRVDVTWEDAESDSAWYGSPDDAKPDAARLCTTRGWLIAANKSRIVVAHTISRENIPNGPVHFNGHITIPRGMIRKLRISKTFHG